MERKEKMSPLNIFRNLVKYTVGLVLLIPITIIAVVFYTIFVTLNTLPKDAIELDILKEIWQPYRG